MKNMAILLNKDDFEKRIYGQSIRKPIVNGIAAVHFSFINHEDNFDITVDVGIRYNELENMKNEDVTYLTTKEKSNTFTIGAELGNMSIGQQKRWRVYSIDDIDLVTSSMYEDIKNVIFPFIEKYSSREKAFNLCIKDDLEANLFCAFDDNRAINAIGLALILNKDDQLKELVLKKKKYLEDKNDEFQLSNFLMFINKYIH